jgi:hypothetical protein
MPNLLQHLMSKWIPMPFKVDLMRERADVLTGVVINKSKSSSVRFTCLFSHDFGLNMGVSQP